MLEFYIFFGSYLLLIGILYVHLYKKEKISNVIFIVFTLFLMIASIKQETLKIKIEKETLILILFNFIIINYKYVTSLISKITKLKLGFIEFEKDIESIKETMSDYAEKNKINEENVSESSTITAEEGKLIFLKNFFIIESKLRKIATLLFEYNIRYLKTIKVNEIYLRIIREYRSPSSMELEKNYIFFKTMVNLRNLLVHNIEAHTFNDIDYKNLFPTQKKNYRKFR